MKRTGASKRRTPCSLSAGCSARRCLCPGQTGGIPRGPAAAFRTSPAHPVIHIAYEDALAYARWKKQRLPTEAECEYAAQIAAQASQKIASPNKAPRDANVWQGYFPTENTLEDGHAGTAPVGCLPPNDT